MLPPDGPKMEWAGITVREAGYSPHTTHLTTPKEDLEFAATTIAGWSGEAVAQPDETVRLAASALDERAVMAAACLNLSRKIGGAEEHEVRTAIMSAVCAHIESNRAIFDELRDRLARLHSVKGEYLRKILSAVKPWEGWMP